MDVVLMEQVGFPSVKVLDTLIHLLQNALKNVCVLNINNAKWICQDAQRAAPGIEPGTSRTRSENHTTRPSSHS